MRKGDGFVLFCSARGHLPRNLGENAEQFLSYNLQDMDIHVGFLNKLIYKFA